MKKIVLVGLVAGLGLNLVMAQTMEQSAVDTATIGSKMIYEVDPDPAIAADANMNASRFDWFFTDDVDATITAGITLDETPSGGSYAESQINVTFDGGTYGAGTSIKVKTAEVSQPLFGTGCSGNEQEIDIFFVAVPTVTLANGSGGGCGITSASVPLSVNGYGPFEVSFTVTHTDAGGSNTVHNYQETIGVVSDKGASSLNLVLNTTDHLVDGTGIYEVVVDDITDRFSQKSQVAIAGGVTSGTYTIGINPTPTTQPIRHIRNL